MEDASNGAIDKAAEALTELAKQSSILEDSVKENIKANKQAPRELAKVMDRLEKQGDALITAQKKYRDTLKEIQARQAAAQKAAAGSVAAERKAKADALRAERAANRELKKQLTDLGISAANAAGKIDALAAEAKANKATIQKVAADLSKPSAKIGKALDGMHSKVQNSISGLGKFTAVMALAKKAVTELYGQSIRLANKGLVGSMAQMNISAMKLRMTAEEFEGLVSANRDMVALMGGGAQGIENFQSVLNESSVGLEYLGKEGKKAAATIMAGFNRAGFGIMSSNNDISKAYQDNVKGLNKQFKMFNGIFGDTAEQFANLYEQQLKSEALQAKMLSGDTRGYALQLKEMMVRTETLKLMGLNNEQIIAMSKRVDSLFNPKENRQGEAMSERVSARQALSSGAQVIKTEDPELAAKIDDFVKSGEMAKFQQMSTEDKKNYMTQNAELFKGISKMEQMIAAQRDRDGGDTSTRGMVFTDRAKAAGREYSMMSEFGKDLNTAKAQGYDQTPEGRMKLAAKGFENVMSDVNGETTALGKAFGKLRDSVEMVTGLLNNPFTTALTAIGAALLFASTSIKSAVAGAAEMVMSTAKLMAGSVGGLFKGLFTLFKKIPILSSIFGGIEGAWEAFNTDTEEYYKRSGIDREATVVPQVLKDLGVRMIGTLSDVGSATMKAATLGMYDKSKDFADKQEEKKKTEGMAIPSATKLPNAAQPQVQQPQQPVKGTKPISDDVLKAITSGAKTAGVDPAYMLAMGDQESSFNPNAKAGTSSAKGLFQFTNGTWKSMVQKYGEQYGIGLNDQFDPAKNALMGALFTRDNKAALTAQGNDTSSSSLYAAHFLGAGGANKLLTARKTDPKQSAAALMPEAAGANQSVFYNKDGTPKSVDEVYGFFDKHVSSKVDKYAAMIGQAPGAKSSVATPPFAPTGTAPQLTTPQLPPQGPTGPADPETEKRRALIAANSAAPKPPVAQTAGSTSSGSSSPVVDELQKHTGLLNVMVTLLGKTEASRRGYQMDAQTGMSVAT